MRAFDLLSNAEQDIRTASHPRYQFEMVLLKWMHTRKLVSLTDLLASGGSTVSKPQIPNPKAQIPSRPSSSASPAKSTAAPSNPESRIANPDLKDKLLAEIRSGKATFYNTVVAQEQRIDVTTDR